MRIKVLAPLLLIFSSLITSFEARSAEAINLTFGLYQSDKATVMYRKFLPVLEYLQDAMEQELNQSVDIELRIFKTYEEANDALVDGSVDFVRFGPASYVLAKERNEDIELLVMEEVKGKKRFSGLIVVQKDSPVQSLGDLRGASFAFGDNTSTIGRYLSQAVLVDEHIYATDLSKFEYLDRHDRVFKAVEVGDFTAGALKDSTFKKMNKEGQLRVLSSFDNVTKPWIARAGLDGDVYSAIKSGLINLQDEAVLSIFKASAFVPTSDSEYSFVREGMAKSAAFER